MNVIQQCELGQLESVQQHVYGSINVSLTVAFQKACRHGCLEVAKWIHSIQPTINVSARREYAFKIACKYSHLEVAKWLYSIQPSDVSACGEFAFRSACENGHLRVAQWLYQINLTLDVYEQFIGVFLSACRNEHLEVAQWIHSIKPMNESTLKFACENGHPDVVQWILSIKPLIDVPANKNLKVVQWFCAITLLLICLLCLCWLAYVVEKNRN